MFVAACVVLLLASVPLLGSRLGDVTRLRLRSGALLWVALGVQVLVTEVVPGWPRPVLAVLHVSSYALAGVVVWRDRHVPGLLLLGAGGALNGLVIALNGGTLPADPAALRAAGIVEAPGSWANSGVVAHPVLPWLGDAVATPAWLPFRNVFSVGDGLVLLGAAVLLHAVGGSRPARALAARWAAAQRSRRSRSASSRRRSAAARCSSAGSGVVS